MSDGRDEELGELGKIGEMGAFTIRAQLRYKCLQRGSKLVVVDRWFPSSRLCHNCRWKHQKLKLKDRMFRCERCHLEISRDLNAAKNLKQVYQECPSEWDEKDECFKITDWSSYSAAKPVVEACEDPGPERGPVGNEGSGSVVGLTSQSIPA